MKFCGAVENPQNNFSKMYFIRMAQQKSKKSQCRKMFQDDHYLNVKKYNLTNVSSQGQYVAAVITPQSITEKN